MVDADYDLTVPDGIDPAATAQLLCAGITTYALLRRWGARPDGVQALPAPADGLPM